MATLEWKQKLYQRFKQCLPPELRDDAWFSIFYSDVRPSPVAILGLNPGGNPKRPDTILRISTFYENGEHEYVAFRKESGYPIAGRMCTLLKESGLVLDWESIRWIPKSNTIFHRSRRLPELEDPVGAEQLARPFVDELLAEIDPRIILFGGKEAFDWFAGPRWPAVEHRAGKPVSRVSSGGR